MHVHDAHAECGCTCIASILTHACTVRLNAVMKEGAPCGTQGQGSVISSSQRDATKCHVPKAGCTGMGHVSEWNYFQSLLNCANLSFAADTDISKCAGDGTYLSFKPLTMAEAVASSTLQGAVQQVPWLATKLYAALCTFCVTHGVFICACCFQVMRQSALQPILS